MKDFSIILLAIFCATFSVAQILPEDFYLQKVSQDYTQATNITFDEKGRMYILEKAGYVYIIDTNGVKIPQPLIDIHEEVGNWRDHGLLGFALDPDFYGNGRYYLMYAVDRHHLLYYGTPQYHPDSMTTYRASIGRVTRYTADPATGFTTTLPNSRKVLLGESISTGIPIMTVSHGVGALIFGKDGTLLVSAGDGTSNAGRDVGGDTIGTYASAAIADGIMTPDQDVGVYKSQYIGSLNGKVLRINPETGDGIPNNPFYDIQNPRSPQSRVWALGLRNPFRITLKPNTGSHLASDGNPGHIIVGDVGSSFHEELDVVDGPGQNFGWPLWEGHFNHWTFRHYWSPPNYLAPNPLYGVNGCTKEYFNFQDLVREARGYFNHGFQNSCDNTQEIPSVIPTFTEKPPAISWRNKLLKDPVEAFTHYFAADGYKMVVNIEDDLSDIEGSNFEGTCSIGGTFYEGTIFPEKYQGVYFHADFDGWLKAFYFDDNNKVTKVEDFLSGVNNLTTIAYNPKDECLYYVRYEDGIYKICYGGNAPPVAVIEADQNYGATPLEIQFTGENSYDVFGDNLTYAWDFGDGTTATTQNVSHTFTTSDNQPKAFTVRLTVTDSLGLKNTAEQIISLNNTPPVINITSFEEGDLYPIDKDTQLPLWAEVNDAETNADNLVYEWTTYLHHNTHFHQDPADNRKETYTVINPLGCGEETYYFRIGLSVTDEHGLTTTQEKSIYPNCEPPFVDFLKLESTPFSDSIVLNWTTNFEESVLYFDVERSVDIWNFKKIGRISATGSPNELADYQFTDKEQRLGVSFYRIKAYRVNQAFAYSERISELFSKDFAFLYPNPSTGLVNLYFSESFENVSIRWFNAQGQQVMNETFTNVKNSIILPMQLGDLADGVYFYEVQGDNNQKTTGRILLLR